MTGSRFNRRALLAAAVGVLAPALSGCPKPKSAAPGGGSGGNRLTLELWHTRQGDQVKVLRSIISDYEAQHPGVTIQEAYQGSYGDLFKKVLLATQTKTLPAFAVAYENMIADYMRNDIVRPLNDLVNDPQIGFSAENLVDIPEVFLTTNTFPQFDNQLLSFPFTKSVLCLYYNLTLLKKAGFQAPPKTWDEFERQCAAVRRLTGKPAVALDQDASTFDGIIFSFGGDVITSEGTASRFDQPATVQAFTLLQRLVQRKLGVETPRQNVPNSFVGQQVAFAFRSSSQRANLEQLVEELGPKRFEWGVALPPHGKGQKPVTVLYGPNVCIFRSTPERERAAWEFIKYFISAPVTARWGRETGYLPVRISAAELPEMKAFYQANPRARAIYDMLPAARAEPNVAGWQEVRDRLEAAVKQVWSGDDPAAVARQLKREADKALRESG